MSNRRRVLRRGPLNGKTIEMAPMAGVEMYDEIAEDFMAHVFGFEPGQVPSIRLISVINRSQVTSHDHAQHAGISAP